MTENMTERDLLAECRNGNRESLQTLFVENQRRIFSVALNFFGGDQELAKDITQQVFLKLLTKIENFRAEAEFTTWLYRITVNACLDEKRKTRQIFSVDFLGNFGLKHSPDDKIYQREIVDEVQKVLAMLKPKFRLPLLLKYSEDLSYEQIAKILDCSIGTVSSRLNRGHKLLASKLKHLKGEI